MNSKDRLAVIVGRFQVHRMTAGHLDLFNWVLEKHRRVFVLLGSSPTRVVRRNALTYEMRAQMIRDEYPNEDFHFAELRDVGNDERWSKKVDETIRRLFLDADPTNTVLYGSRDSFVRSYSGDFVAETIVNRVTESGTSMRDRILHRKNFSDDFRAGMIYAAYHKYPAVFPTVDVAIMDGNNLLLVRKPNESLYRFCGGFADPTSESYEDDAIREVKEELGIEIKNLRYVGSKLVDDWRYRQERDKIKTILFIADDCGGTFTPQDDIEAGRWFRISELSKDKIVPEHGPVLDLFHEWMWKMNPDAAHKILKPLSVKEHPLYQQLFGPTSSWQPIK